MSHQKYRTTNIVRFCKVVLTRCQSFWQKRKIWCSADILQVRRQWRPGNRRVTFGSRQTISRCHASVTHGRCHARVTRYHASVTHSRPAVICPVTWNDFVPSFFVYNDLWPMGFWDVPLPPIPTFKNTGMTVSQHAEFNFDGFQSVGPTTPRVTGRWLLPR